MKKAAVPSILVAVVMLTVAVIAEAQQAKKVPRIGFLGGASASSYAVRIDAFRQDVIVAAPTPSVLADKKASATIPIVFVSVGDPVGSGLVASLARPGENITGLTVLVPELSGKRLELLKEAIPNVIRGSTMESSQSSAGTRMERDSGRSTGTTSSASIS